MINLSSLDLNNKNLVIRVDMNVPIKNGDVLDSTRIKACLSTIEYALKNNAKVLLISHLGRPIEGNFDNNIGDDGTLTYNTPEGWVLADDEEH